MYRNCMVISPSLRMLDDLIENHDFLSKSLKYTSGLLANLPVEPRQAGWRKFRGGEAYEEKIREGRAGEPIGITPDRLALTAVHCAVISWRFLMMPLSLDPVCLCHLRILTAPPVDSCEARDLTQFSLLTNFFPYSFHFPNLFTSLLFSLLYSFFLFTFLFSALLCSFHSSLPCSLHSPLSSLPTLFTSLLSSLPYSLHFPTLFTSLVSSLPLFLFFLNVPTVFTSLLFTSLLSSGSGFP